MANTGEAKGPISLREGATLQVQGGRMVVREVLDDWWALHTLVNDHGELVRLPILRKPVISDAEITEMDAKFAAEEAGE